MTGDTVRKEISEGKKFKIKAKLQKKKIETNKKIREAKKSQTAKMKILEDKLNLPKYVRGASVKNEDGSTLERLGQFDQMLGLAEHKNKASKQLPAEDEEMPDQGDGEEETNYDHNSHDYKKEKSSQLSLLDAILGKPTTTTSKPSKEEVVAIDDSQIELATVRSSSIMQPIAANTSAEASKPRKKGRYHVMACEYVGVQEYGRTDSLARVVVVDNTGKTVYDEYVKQHGTITDYRTETTGLKDQHFINAKGITIIRGQVRNLVKRLMLVGYDLFNDITALRLELHPSSLIRDLSYYQPVKKELMVHNSDSIVPFSAKLIQSHHITNTVEKAQAMLQIYATYEQEYEQFYEDRVFHDFFYLSQQRAKKSKPNANNTLGEQETNKVIQKRKQLRQMADASIDELTRMLKK